MSRLAAMKEYAFMKALEANGFSVPQPISQNRHTIVLSLVDAFPLRQIAEVPDPASLYSELMDMIVRLARFGLIHGDFNEFNLLIKEVEVNGEESDAKGKAPEGESSEDATTTTIEEEENEEQGSANIRLVPVLIDFPQMVSVDHANAEMYFDRDVNCIKRFFQRKYHFVSDEPGPFFADARKQLLQDPEKRLDINVEASGFSRKMAKELEAYMKEVGANQENEGSGDEDGEEGEEEEEEGSENEEVDDSSRRLGDLRVS